MNTRLDDRRTLDEHVTDVNRKAIRLAIATLLASQNSILTHGHSVNQEQAVDYCFTVADMLIAKSGL